MRRGVNLNGNDIRGIQDLHQDRKTRVRVPVAKYLAAVTYPEFMQRDSLEISLRNHTLDVFAVDKFPRLANRVLAREFAVKMGLQFVPTPNSFHVQGLKSEAFGIHNQY